MPVLPLTSAGASTGPPSSSWLSRLLSSAWGGGKESSTLLAEEGPRQQQQQAGVGPISEVERDVLDGAHDEATKSTSGNPIFSTSSSQAVWRYKLHKALWGKVMLISNAWTATLVLTILLAVVFRALQPTEEPGIGVAHYAWRADPLDPGQRSLAELDLDVRGTGCFTMEFDPSIVELYPMEADELVSVEHREEAALAALKLAEMSTPNWSLTRGHNIGIVSAKKPSGYFSTGQNIPGRGRAGGDDDIKQVILTVNMYGFVTVFASLPSRIFMKCYVMTDLASVKGPRCESVYLPHIKRGAVEEGEGEAGNGR